MRNASVLSTHPTLGPMGLESQGGRVAKTVATRSDSVAIDVCELLEQALILHGYTDHESQGAVFRMSRKNWQKAITTTPNYDSYNQVMKRLGQIPGDVVREFFALGSAKVGLVIGVNHEKAEAAMRLADAVNHLLRVGVR